MMHAYKLKFHSALHVDAKGTGTPEGVDEFVHSDTISAALCLSWGELWPEDKPAIFSKPPFLVSSAFPYIGNILLFPTPIWRCWKKIPPERRKAIKGIRWLSRDLFMSILVGNMLDIDAVHHLPCGIAISEAEHSRNPHFASGGYPWIKDERQRVSVDRLTLPVEGGLFFFPLQFFSAQSGLYFLANMESGEKSRLRATLDFLGDTGLGADRNCGLGHFTVSGEEDFALPQIGKPDGWVTLSLFNPGPEDNLPSILRKTAYGIDTRSGWIVNSTFGRPPIHVFTEGSYFSEKPRGRVVEMLSASLKSRHGFSHLAPRDFRAVSLPSIEPAYLKEATA